MNQVESYKDLTDLVRILSKYKKKLPNAKVISLSKNRINKEVAVGYIETKYLNLTYIEEDKVLTPKEFLELNSPGYSEVIILG